MADVVDLKPKLTAAERMALDAYYDEPRYWVAKKDPVTDREIGRAYRLSPHPNANHSWWQLEVDQGDGWTLIMVRSREALEQYVCQREGKGRFLRVDDIASPQAKRWRKLEA